MSNYCEFCDQKFKDTDDVIIGEDGLFHEEECFMEYCFTEYGSSIFTFKEVREMDEELE